MVRDLFKHASIYFFGSLISKAVTTLAWITLAKVLIPEDYGQFTLFFMLLQLITFLADFGLNQYYLKKVDSNDKNVLLNKILFARTMTLIFSIFITAAILFFYNIFTPFISLIFILSLIPMSYLSVTEGYYLKQKKSFRVSLKFASIGGICLLGFFFFYKYLDLTRIFLLLLLSLIFTLIWFFPWKKIKFIKISFTELISMLKSSSAYAYLTLTSFFYNRGDSFVISSVKGNTALGIYGLAYRFLESLALFSTSITQILFPRSAKKDGIKFAELIKITLLMLLSGLILSLIVYLFSDFLIVGIFSLQYSEAVPILKIFSAVLLLFFINAPLATVVQSSNLVKKFLPYGIINTLLNILLNILLIPKFGITAAAWVMVISECIGLIINIFFTRKLYAH